MKKLFGLLLVFVAVFALVSCTDTTKQTTEKVYTYNTYTSVSPSNWNELTYKDSNDTQIMSYIGSSFFEYNFEFDAKGNIVEGRYAVEYSAATKLEDVTAQYATQDNEWGLEVGATQQAYKITLRKDLKWDDGTPITAADFVYTMKQQLDPLFQNYRADSFYVGSTQIHNAREYVFQGQVVGVDNYSATAIESTDDLVKNQETGVYQYNDNGTLREVRFMIGAKSAWCSGNSLKQYGAYLDATAIATLVGMMDENGYVDVTDETINLVGQAINTAMWGESPDNWPMYVEYDKAYEEVDFEDVGIFVGDNEYELVVVLDVALDLLNEDGSLSYKAAYNFASLPLVKESLYEANKVAPSAGNTLWTTTYNSSVASTASWGPYKLASFQAGKQYKLVRNDNWFGYSIDQYKNQYQTDQIVCETIEGSSSWNTAWLKFQAGEIDGIGIDVSIADEYKTSARAYFTPNDYVASLQLQADKEALASREEAGVNKTILTYTKFRKALSLGINRSDFAAKCTTSSKAGFGLFNSMHYYDVANGGVFRDTDEAKQVLCDVYSVDVDNYASLDDAVASITGYNPTLAKQLITEAYNEALEAGDISATDKVVLTIGTATATESFLRMFNYLKTAYTELCVGTPLEGRIEFDYVEKGDKWGDDFRAGSYDICTGGWSGAAWDPGYFLLAYLSSSYMYSKAWDTKSAMMTFTFQGQEYTMSLMEWYNCLNGDSSAKYNWSSAKLTEEERLPLIAALEKEVLQVYYTVPLYNYFSASLLSYKVDYITYTYNTFMGYGGIRYMTYNYDDATWAETVKTQLNGQIDYR